MSNLSAALDVALGLFFVYLLLSVLTSWLQELITSLLEMRQKNLANAIQNLLDPSVGKLDGNKKLSEEWSNGVTTSDIQNVVRALYEHPIIKSLAQPGKRPSYIPSREFASALFDLLVKAGSPASPAKKGIADLRKGIEKLQNQSTREALLALIDSAEATETQVEQQLASMRTSVEQWFDTTMERATGWYKRKAQLIAIAIALVVALVLNVDTLGLTQVLWRDPALRNSLSAAATAYIQQNQEAKAAEARQQLESFGLPIGWALPLQLDDMNLATPPDPQKIPATVEDIIPKLIGIIITAWAVSQGSPFWFDLLNQFVNMRLAGSKPGEKSSPSSGG